MKQFVVCLLVACGASSAPTTSTTPPAASCGDKSCGHDEICIEHSVGPGPKAPEGAKANMSYRCADVAETTNDKFVCSEPHGHWQSCYAPLP